MSDDGGETYSENDAGMGGEYSETEYTSGFERFTNSIGGIVVGFFLFFASLGVLGWNEGRAVKTYRAISEGQSNYVDSGCIPDPLNVGKLVHITCPLENMPSLSDNYWGGPANLSAVFLKRSSSMYAWKETKTTTTQKSKSGGGGSTKTTTYSCKQEWTALSSTSSLDNGFKCRVNGGANPTNPVTIPSYASPQTFKAASGELQAGGFSLPGNHLDLTFFQNPILTLFLWHP
jgi:hypothetical protein